MGMMIIQQYLSHRCLWGSNLDDHYQEFNQVPDTCWVPIIVTIAVNITTQLVSRCSGRGPAYGMAHFSSAVLEAGVLLTLVGGTQNSSSVTKKKTQGLINVKIPLQIKRAWGNLSLGWKTNVDVPADYSHPLLIKCDLSTLDPFLDTYFKDLWAQPQLCPLRSSGPREQVLGAIPKPHRLCEQPHGAEALKARLTEHFWKIGSEHQLALLWHQE